MRPAIPSRAMPEDEEPKEAPPEPLLDQIARNEGPLSNLINLLADRFQHETAEVRKYKRALGQAQARTAYGIIRWVLALVGIAIVATTYLVLLGILAGEVLVFLVGTLLGSLITFLTERVTPLLYLPIEEEGE